MACDEACDGIRWYVMACDDMRWHAIDGMWCDDCGAMMNEHAMIMR